MPAYHLNHLAANAGCSALLCHGKRREVAISALLVRTCAVILLFSVPVVLDNGRSPHW